VTVEFKTFSSISTCGQLDRVIVTQVVGPVQGVRISDVVFVEPCGFSAGNILYLQSNDSEVAIFLGGQSFPIEGSAFITDVVRVDGQPDTCGNPPTPDRNPVDLPPGTLPPDGLPVDISDPSDPNDTTPPVIFSPDSPPEYDPYVPIVPTIPGAPVFVFPPGPGDDIPPRVGDPVELPPGGTGEEDTEVPEEDSPDECIGYSWEFYDIPSDRGGIPGSVPSRFYEIFGSAQLRVSSSGDALYDSPVKIDSARGVCYRSDSNLRVRGLSLNAKATFGPVRVRPVYAVVGSN
jgi:hypothetical protein